MDQSVSSQPTTPVISNSMVNTNYASFGRRLAALFLDGVILNIISSIVTIPIFLVMGMNSVSMMSNAAALSEAEMTAQATGLMGSVWLVQLLVFIIVLGYSIFFIGKKGQTLGMMALNIKAIKESTGEVPGYGTATLRAVVAAFLSGPVLGLGYFWVLWDAKKQTWHDKLAQTVVVKL